MTWTSPRTWVAAEKPSAATMNLHIRGNFDDLYTGTGWVAITFDASYVQFNGTNYACQIRRIGSLCVMQGLVKPTVGNFTAGASVNVATLPAAYRPVSVDQVWIGAESTASSTSRNVLLTSGVLAVTPQSADAYVSICHTWVI